MDIRYNKLTEIEMNTISKPKHKKKNMMKVVENNIQFTKDLKILYLTLK
jgi:hypothetical protein